MRSPRFYTRAVRERNPSSPDYGPQADRLTCERWQAGQGPRPAPARRLGRNAPTEGEASASEPIGSSTSPRTCSSGSTPIASVLGFPRAMIAARPWISTRFGWRTTPGWPRPGWLPMHQTQ